jgi:hypothetical protein
MVARSQIRRPVSHIFYVLFQIFRNSVLTIVLTVIAKGKADKYIIFQTHSQHLCTKPEFISHEKLINTTNINQFRITNYLSVSETIYSRKLTYFNFLYHNYKSLATINAISNQQNLAFFLLRLKPIKPPRLY